MPDLESKITAWREEMLTAHISLETVAELEGHLREDIARQTKANVGESEAFDNSVCNLGHYVELRREFKKIGSFRRTAACARDTILSFAGIPNHYMSMNDSSLKLDSRWTTYLRSGVFLFPALVLWSLAALYVIPKFTSLWQKAYIYNRDTAGLAGIVRFDLNIVAFLGDNIVFLAGLVLIGLGLLEWRFGTWPRYRRAVVGLGVFFVNLFVLFSLSLMFLGATFAASQFAIQAAK